MKIYLIPFVERSLRFVANDLYLRPYSDRTYEQIDGALERAAKNREIIVLYAHRISETGTGNFVTPEALTRVFSKANELGLQFYTFDQLP